MIAPLDWGLGHATRCIPIIVHLQKRGYKIIFAGSGAQLVLIVKEFPDIKTTEIKGYNISYTKSKRWFAFKILTQAPKILLSIRREKKAVEALVKQYQPDLLISDNRFGFYHSTVPCVFITHQLHIMAPFKWLEKMILRINYSYINRFNQCWIPDYEGNRNIAGRLSHPGVLPSVPVKYLGPLSRFQHSNTGSFSYQFLFLISGPEPQRSLLEEKVFSVATALNGNVMIVRGKPTDDLKIPAPQNCTVFNHLETGELQEKIAACEFVISRSGYTTVMEILSMQKKSLFIPTPGQTEQEYLAKHLSEQKWCLTCNQDDDLLQALEALKQHPFQLPQFGNTTFAETIDEALKELLYEKS